MKLQNLLPSLQELYLDIPSKDLLETKTAVDLCLQVLPENKILALEDQLSILMPFKPSLSCVLIALLKKLPSDQIPSKTSPEILSLINNANQLNSIKFKNSKNNNEEVKKILVTISKDIRVLLVHLTEIILQLRATEPNTESAEKLAQFGLDIYSPIAEKLDLYVCKAEIEDLSFRLKSPETYKTLTKEIETLSAEQDKIILDGISLIENLFLEKKTPYIRTEGRKKNVYSVYQKMKRKNFSTAKEVFDLFAIRIITNTPEECYQILGILHASFRPISNRFKDYIAVPKPNGYQSLHTTLFGLGTNPNPTEIQIQTKTMYQQAKYGASAHWAYKKNRSSNFSKDFLKKNLWTDPTNFEDENQSKESIFDELTSKVKNERIHVFTPKGDIINLPQKSTPIDFAFAIHSDIGCSVTNAKVNGVIRPLHYELQAGDIVEVITKKGRTPNPLWLNFVKSHSARSKIRNFINAERKEDSIVDEPINSPLPQKNPIRPKSKYIDQTQNTSRLASVMIGGERDSPYKIAQCCTPKNGQKIIAYNSRGLEFMIHKQDCKTIANLEPERFMDATFINVTTIHITSQDRIGLLKEIIETISNSNLNITQTKLAYNDNTTTTSIEVEYIDKKLVMTALAELIKIPNILSAQETTWS